MCWRTPRLWFLLNCVYLSAFFCPFSTFFCLFPPLSVLSFLFLSSSILFLSFSAFPYPFLSFSAFLTLPCLLLSFYILIHLLFTLFPLFASYILPYFALYSPIIYFFSLSLLSLICSLYSLLYILILYILFVLRLYSFYPCFIYRLYNVLSVYNFSCSFRLRVPLINFYLLLFLFMCSRCSDLIF